MSYTEIAMRECASEPTGANHDLMGKDPRHDFGRRQSQAEQRHRREAKFEPGKSA